MFCGNAHPHTHTHTPTDYKYCACVLMVSHAWVYDFCYWLYRADQAWQRPKRLLLFHGSRTLQVGGRWPVINTAAICGYFSSCLWTVCEAMRWTFQSLVVQSAVYVLIWGTLHFVQLQEYELSRSCVDRVLQMEPKNMQAKELKQLVEKKIRRGTVVWHELCILKRFFFSFVRAHAQCTVPMDSHMCMTDHFTLSAWHVK